MSQAWASIVSVLTAIIGVAIIAVLVSQRAQTGTVISAAGKAFSGALAAAEAPVTGGSVTGFTGYAPGYSSFGE